MATQRTQQVFEDDPHDHDRGLSFDVSTLMNRRRALQLVALGGLTTLVGCGSSSGSRTAGASSTTAAATTAATSSDVAGVPQETGGPYPADGSNGPNVLTESGIVRRDITTSFGSVSGSAQGVPLTINLKILDVSAGGTPLAGAAVYLWHCDREGRYSLYSQGATDQNYLRGVQESASDGTLTFESIFPAAYPGRWPHIHFEVYPTLAAATSAGSKLVTSQIALPEDACNLVYAGTGYEQSIQNMSQTSLETDNVFSDGFSTQLATATGTPATTMAIALNVGV